IAPEKPISLSGKKAKPLRKEGTRAILNGLQTHLEAATDWTASDALTAHLQTFAEENDLGFGQFGAPLRALVTAGHPSPDLGVVLYILGREEALGRLEAGLRAHEIN
ncbi:MAG: glutamate--tRNA ligase, partial [Pseudomonadota bacterium]